MYAITLNLMENIVKITIVNLTYIFSIIEIFKWG